MNAHLTPMTLSLTDSAAAQIRKLCTDHSAAMVRLSVEGGGCQGFQYVFGFAQSADATDLVIEQDGAKLVVDDISQPFLMESTLDFIDDLSGAHFKVKNPQATSSCGCGTSFSV